MWPRCNVEPDRSSTLPEFHVWKVRGMALFILTWNPIKWERARNADVGTADEWWDGEVTRWLNGETIDTDWSTGSRDSGIGKGDSGILLRQGRDRGMIALGQFTGEWRNSRHWDGRAATLKYACIEFTQLVDTEDRLPTETLMRKIPDVKWRYLMQSGVQVSSDDEREILSLWKDHWSQISD